MASDSEYICEVVRIEDLRPHGNADKLEIATIRTKHGLSGYVIVVQKGSFKPGSLAAYVGTDCVVPLYPAPPGLEFLRDKTTRKEHRVRAAKLRGVFSEGILVPAPVGCILGHELSQEWGISQYVAPVKGEPTAPGVSTGPGPTKNGHMLGWPDYSVTSLKKVPGLFLDGQMCSIDEKIHGANGRAGHYKGQLVVGSHHCIKTPILSAWQSLARKICPRFLHKYVFPESKGYYGEDIWTKAVKPYAEKMATKPNFVFYYEVYGPGVQPMHYGLKEPKVTFFDIWDSETKTWLTKSECDSWFVYLGLPTPPNLYTGPYPGIEAVRMMAEGPSLYGGNIREGVVVSDWNSATKGKCVGQGYLLMKEGEGR